MKRTIGTVLTVAALMTFTSVSFASNSDLLNSALNENLHEREQVTGSYRENEAANRPEVSAVERNDDTRIAVELTEGGLQSGLTSVSKPLRDHDSRSRVYRETRVEANLDKEVKAVDRAFSREATSRDTTKRGG